VLHSLLLMACRYEELQRQLVNAQAAAEIEEEEAELARAAAAVARLVAPDSPTNNSSNNSSSGGNSSGASPGSSTGAGQAAGSNGNKGRGSGAASTASVSLLSSDDEGAGPAAAKLRLLEQEVEEALQEVHSAPEDDAPSAGLSMRH
jgi:hypothetical protein